MSEMASRYVQTVLDSGTFKRLKVEAIYQDKPLGDLLREIVEEWVNQLDKEGEHHGRRDNDSDPGHREKVPQETGEGSD